MRTIHPQSLARATTFSRFFSLKSTNSLQRFLPPEVYNQLILKKITPAMQEELQRIISKTCFPLDPLSEATLTPEQIRLIAIKLAARHIPPDIAEKIRNIGNTFNQRLIEKMPNDFIKTLFSIPPVGTSDSSSIYHSPNVVKAAFTSLEKYDHPTMVEVISHSLARAGNALDKLGTENDVFKLKSVNSKQLNDFQNRYITSQLQSEVMNQSIGEEVASSFLLLSALRDASTKTDCEHNDPITTHLVLIPHLLNGGKVSSVNFDKNMKSLTETMEKGEKLDVIEVLLNNCRASSVAKIGSNANIKVY
jgi:hypothetical protein